MKIGLPNANQVEEPFLIQVQDLGINLVKGELRSISYSERVLDNQGNVWLCKESCTDFLSQLVIDKLTILDKGEGLCYLLPVLLKFINVHLHYVKSILVKLREIYRAATPLNQTSKSYIDGFHYRNLQS